MFKIRTTTYEKLLCAVLVFGLIFGGAGYDSPQYIAVLRICAAIIIAIEVPRLRFERMESGAKAALVLAGLLVLLMALQMVPVPPAIWANMPGRSLARDVYAALGWQDRWRPMSLAPDEGVTALLKVLLAIAGFLAVARLTTDRRSIAIRIVVLAAVAGAVLGIVQFATGGALTLWVTDHQGAGVGLMVDRNHQSLFLEIAIGLAGLPGVIRRDGKGRGGMPMGGLPMVLGIWVILSLGVLATTSRMGIALLLPALAGALAITARIRGIGRRTLMIAGCVTVACIGLSFTPIAQQMLARYATLADDLRYSIWANSWLAARSALPLGLGFGSFVDAYLTVEPLDQVITRFVNHAHNEYLEWLIEGGIPAALLFAGALFVLVRQVTSSLTGKPGGRQRAMALAASLAIALSLLHSMSEFPLRTPTLSILLGMMTALLFRAPGTAPSVSHLPRGRLTGAIVLGVLAVPASAFAVSAALAVVALNNNDSDTAVRVAPWMADTLNAQAQDRIVAHDMTGAERAGMAALAIQPLNEAALRNVAVARSARPASGDDALRLFDLAGRLGWRDSTTQLVLLDVAVAHHNARDAARHLDAIARQFSINDQFWMGLSKLLSLPDGADALAERIALGSDWRTLLLRFYPVQDGATPQHFEEILAALQRHGIPATAYEAGVAENHLMMANAYDDMAKVRALTAQGTLVSDPDFETATLGPMTDLVAPGGWYSTALPGTSVSIESPEQPWHGVAATVASQGLMSGKVFGQLLVLPPGDYRLSALVQSSDAQPADVATGWEFLCRAGEDISDPIPLALTWTRERDGWRRATSDFSVAKSCPGQELGFMLLRAPNTSYKLAVDDVSIVRRAPDQVSHSGAR